MSFLTAALSVGSLIEFVGRRGLLDRSGRSTDAIFLPVEDSGALDRVFEKSREATEVIFLHDPHCSISVRAHQRVSESGGEIFLIDVSRQHDLNRIIAERTGVRHESPQVIVLRDGQPIWYASHGAIATEGLNIARGI